jgi:hypothetical protein
LFYPWLTTAREAILSGRLPLWDSNQFGGYPFLANPQVALFYPPTWLAILLPTHIGISLYIALHLWLAGVGMLLFVRHMGGSWLGAGLAALAFMFSGFMTARIFAGHLGLVATDSWLPWLLLATGWSVRRGDAASAVVAGLPFGLAILAGHSTSLIHIGFAWIGFVLYLFITHARRWSVLRQAAIVILTGLALSAVQTIPFLEFSRVSARSAAPNFEFASAFSFPPAHLIALLIPEFFGEPTRAGYWSVPNFEELTYYVGVLPLLALIVALRRPTRSTWFYVALMAFGLLAALGSYGFLYRLLYDLLPPFRLARAPARAAFLFTFAASALLGETITILQRDEGLHRRFMRLLPLIAGVLGIAGLAATGAAFAAQHPTDTSGRLWHQVGGWAAATILLVIGGALLARLDRNTRNKAPLYIGLALILLADLWLFGFKLIRLEPTAPAAVWSEAKQIIGETDQRVLPWGFIIFGQNGAGQVGLNSVFGYNALEIASNQAFAASVPIRARRHTISRASSMSSQAIRRIAHAGIAHWRWWATSGRPGSTVAACAADGAARYAAGVIEPTEVAVARVHARIRSTPRQSEPTPLRSAPLDAPGGRIVEAQEGTG